MSQETFKENVDSNNNLKSARPRMILEWHLFLTMLLGFVRIILSFVGKHLKFLLKRYLFIFCIFYLNEEELNQQICLTKCVENETLPSTKKKKKKKKRKKRERGENFKSINSKTPEKLSLVTPVANYHKLSLSRLVARPWRKFEKRKLVLNFQSCYCYFK